MAMIPPGYYNAVAVETETDTGKHWVQFGESKEKKTRQVLINFEIIEGPYSGQRIPWFGYFTPDTSKRTVESLRYCGFRGDDLAAILEQNLDQEVSLSVEHHEYDGKTYARVAWVNRSGGGGVKLASPMSPDQLRLFGAQLRHVTAAVPEAPGKKAERKPPTPQAAAAPANGTAGQMAQPPSSQPAGGQDDIPF